MILVFYEGTAGLIEKFKIYVKIIIFQQLEAVRAVKAR